jgi:hypothetical protein
LPERVKSGTWLAGSTLTLSIAVAWSMIPEGLFAPNDGLTGVAAMRYNLC